VIISEMIEVVNQQRYKRIDRKRWEEFARQAMQKVGKEYEGVTIAFVSNRKIRELNKRFRKLDKTTDVLSFPTDNDNDRFSDSSNPMLGEIAIAVERAAEQASENGLEFDQEIAQLILHGLLHLCGYDHETDNGEMNRLELQLRRKLRI